MPPAKASKPKSKQSKPNRAELSAGIVERVTGDIELRASMLDSASTPEDNGAISGHNRLSFDAIEVAYQKDPMVFGGINKRATDTCKKWHYFESVDPNEDDPDAEIVAKLEALQRRVGLRAVATQAVLDSILYGDAYNEIVTENDNPSAGAVIGPGRIVELPRIVPKTIVPVREKAATRDHGKLKHYLQRAGAREVRLHPSRVERLCYVPFGDDQRGLGAVEAAIRTIVAKEKGDNAAGDQLAWYAKGFHVVKIADATTEELETAWKEIRAAKRKGTNEFVGSDRHDYQVHNAAVVNPQPFNDSFHYNLASALGMPKDVLIGASAGAVTGSETNLRDYYEALDAFLQTKLTPWLERIYARELGVEVDALPVRIVWNKLYVNEKSEADTRFQNAQAASRGWQDTVLTRNEYRWLAFGLDPIEGGDTFYEPMERAFPGFGTGGVDEPEPEDPTSELKALAGDNA